MPKLPVVLLAGKPQARVVPAFSRGPDLLAKWLVVVRMPKTGWREIQTGVTHIASCNMEVSKADSTGWLEWPKAPEMPNPRFPARRNSHFAMGELFEHFKQLMCQYSCCS